MDGKEIGIGLVLGMMPYRMEQRHQEKKAITLHIQAVFWSLTMRRQTSGRINWKVCIPLIEHLRDAIWAAILQLRNGDHPH